MNRRYAQLLHRLVSRRLCLMLATAAVTLLWILAGLDMSGVFSSTAEPVELRVGRNEFILVLILLLLNVLMTYTLLRRMSGGGGGVRASLSTILASMLALCLWTGLNFLPFSLMGEQSEGVRRMDGVELWMAMVLILFSALGTLLLIRRFGRAKELLVMSAYSKKVRCGEEWLSIEEYLERELGIVVSHGITPDERDKVMEEFRRESAQKGIPHPGDS